MWGSRGPYVKLVQSDLNTLMNAGLVLDGKFGKNTYGAVIDFQKKYGLHVDGVVGNKTWGKLTYLMDRLSGGGSSGGGSSSGGSSGGLTTEQKIQQSSTKFNHYAGTMPLLDYGSQGSAVGTLQALLNMTDGYHIADDGIFGSQTRSAVRSFQAQVGLHVDGIVGPKTWAAAIVVGILTQVFKKVHFSLPSIQIGLGPVARAIDKIKSHTLMFESDAFTVLSVAVGFLPEIGMEESNVLSEEGQAASEEAQQLASEEPAAIAEGTGNAVLKEVDGQQYKLIGNNPVAKYSNGQLSRINTDLSGGQSKAENIFNDIAKGNRVVTQTRGGTTIKTIFGSNGDRLMQLRVAGGKVNLDVWQNGVYEDIHFTK